MLFSWSRLNIPIFLLNLGLNILLLSLNWSLTGEWSEADQGTGPTSCYQISTEDLALVKVEYFFERAC